MTNHSSCFAAQSVTSTSVSQTPFVQWLISRSVISSIGAFVTFGLFVFMAQLIKTDHIYVDSPSNAPQFDIGFVAKPEPKVTKKSYIEPQPLPVKVDRIAPPAVDTSGADALITNVPAPVIENNPEVFGQTKANSDAIPVVQVEPQYPVIAARDGKEGYVVVMFDISAAGGVLNAKVVEAEPKRTFNRAALQAISNWKYKPKLIDGKAVAQTGLQVRLDFALDK
ncbi:energy transducer TonB [Shewanella sp. WXL01]|uniref:energy transducer TonB n=1 Tax=Shewanella sp. WXL01 TaxID=2709721 RepID=UPI001438434D|nr:energy transducer TonB [Shewanella sp. WXL01]NKF50863.1 energy transducer TonB [Shewanella sp. WXL01]